MAGAPPGWLAGFRRGHRLAILGLAAAALALSPALAALPPGQVAAAATAAALLGVPHGALDYRVAAPHLVGRAAAGPARFGLFAAPYLLLAGLVLLLWLAAPGASLLVFLALSALHFGLEDAEAPGALEVLARGGLPVAVPALAQPEGVGRFFAALAGPPAAVPPAVEAAAWLWAGAALAFAGRLLLARRWGALAEFGALGAVLAALPALAGFALYFVGVHAVRHTAALAARADADDAGRAWRWAARASLPLTAATAALGLGLHALLPGEPAERFQRAVYWGLAALTVPHMALVWLDARLGSPPLLSPAAGPAAGRPA